jgi:3-hydroxyacyl-CoA dehydrogenase/enoyl-CoA hydratase/3-hydroxybutyryl-CoA epimerase
MTVTLQDRSEELIQPALDRARAYVDKRLKDGQAAAEVMARLRADVAGTGVALADVVIEAIVEKVEVKRALFADIEPRLKPEAVLATNTSSIKIESLAAGLKDPRRLVGIHFVAGQDTDEGVVQSATAFTRRLDKLPLPCRSSPGFVVNRILMPYINEALFALEDGIPAATIDRAGTYFGMPMGPIELADIVGLDVCLQVGRVLGEAFHRTAPGRLQALVEQGKLGRKTGQGFYRWRDGKPRRDKPPPGPPPRDLEDRLMLPMLNEAVAALRENVIADTDLLDAGVIFATGFAPFRGGPLHYAKSRGIAEVVRRLSELENRYGERFRPDAGWAQLNA